MGPVKLFLNEMYLGIVLKGATYPFHLSDLLFMYSWNFQAYLSLPEGTASVAGFIAMMTDYYSNMVRWHSLVIVEHL